MTKAYAITNNIEAWDTIPDAPAKLLALAEGEKRERVEAATGVPLDTPSAVMRAKTLLSGYIASGHVAVEGRGGDDTTYAVAAEVLNLGVSIDKAAEIMAPWSDRCVPPWNADELLTKIMNAAEYAQNDQGAWAVPPVADRIPTEALDKLIADSDSAPEAPAPGATVAREFSRQDLETHWKKFKPVRACDFSKLPEPTYLVDQLIPAKSTVLIYGPFATFKSFVALEILASVAASVAQSVPVFGKYKVNKPGPSVSGSGEQPAATGKVRVPAWCNKRGVDIKDSKAFPFVLVPGVPLVSELAEVKAFVAYIKEEGIKPVLVMLDTITRAMGGLDLNDAKSAGLMTAAADYIIRELDCSVILIGHTGKDDSRGLLGFVVISANIDAIFKIERPLKKGPAIRLICEKMKEADPPADIHLRADKWAGALVLNPITPDEYKALTAKDGGDGEVSTAAIVATLRSHGFVGATSCGTRILAHQMLSDEGELDDDDPKGNERRINKRRDQITNKRKTDKTLQALGVKTSGRTSGLEWSVPASDRVEAPHD